MFLEITWIPQFVILLTAICAYFSILVMVKDKGLLSFAGNNKKGQAPDTLLSTDLLPLIERPFNPIIGNASDSSETDVVDEGWEFADDNDNLLLKEAEKVVEEIQSTIDHIASNPPNPEEVSSKINAIVRQYKVFENTEYFEAINSFIAVSVERDCKIKYSEDELLALWN
jgi:flagellar basal body-associated protein FliL